MFSGSYTYFVLPGDTIESIAQRFKLNKLDVNNGNPDITEGQALVLPEPGQGKWVSWDFLDEQQQKLKDRTRFAAAIPTAVKANSLLPYYIGAGAGLSILALIFFLRSGKKKKG